MREDVTSVQGLGNLIFLGLLFFIFYFMLIRPNKKRAESHRRLVESIGVGDEVVTAGGLHGTIKGLGDDLMELEIAPGTVVKYEKTYILRRIDEELEGGEDEELEQGAGSA